ncbi:hypothetical protein [Algoriphagus namhaensis]
MKRHHLLFALFFGSAAICFSCSESSENSSYAIAQEEKTPATQRASSSWLMDLMIKSPLDEAEYIALAPAQLYGFPLISAEAHPSLNGFIAFYAHQEGSEHPGLRLEVIDGAGNDHFQHANAVYKLLETTRKESGENFQSEIKDYQGERVLLVAKKKQDKLDHQLEYLQNNRYHIGIIGNGVGEEEILGAFQQLQKNQFPS